jgi:hypothetical protein
VRLTRWPRVSQQPAARQPAASQPRASHTSATQQQQQRGTIPFYDPHTERAERLQPGKRGPTYPSYPLDQEPCAAVFPDGYVYRSLHRQRLVTWDAHGQRQIQTWVVRPKSTAPWTPRRYQRRQRAPRRKFHSYRRTFVWLVNNWPHVFRQVLGANGVSGILCYDLGPVFAAAARTPHGRRRHSYLTGNDHRPGECARTLTF